MGENRVSSSDGRLLLEEFVAVQRRRRTALASSRQLPPHSEAILDWLADAIAGVLESGDAAANRLLGALGFPRAARRPRLGVRPYQVAVFISHEVRRGVMVKAAVADAAKKWRTSERKIYRLLQEFNRDIDSSLLGSSPLGKLRDYIKEKSRRNRRTTGRRTRSR